MENSIIATAQLVKINKLFELYKSGGIPEPERHVVYPSLGQESKESYLYFTLPCSINFQRSSPSLWKSALDTYNDAETRFLFDPELVVNTSMADVQSGMKKHKLALQYNKHPHIWKTISHTLVDKFEGDPRRIIAIGENSIPKIIQILNANKQGFPYLSGLKISNYWLFILSRFTNVQYTDAQQLSIIPDTHVIRASIHMGLVPNGSNAQLVDKIWRSILDELSIPPGEMHSALWLWSRNQFHPIIDE